MAERKPACIFKLLILLAQYLAFFRILPIFSSESMTTGIENGAEQANGKKDPDAG